MEHTGDLIADVVQEQFHSLPAKRKPLSRGNDVQEWVPLSGIVAEGAFLLVMDVRLSGAD
jgi:tRNA-specific adenosine deaminase 1